MVATSLPFVFNTDMGIQNVPGVGGPSVHVLLLLINKETALDLLIGYNLGKGGN